MNQELHPPTRTLHVVVEHGPERDALIEQQQARLEFAEALGRQQVREQPELFDRQFVGRWNSLSHFVDDFIEESGVMESIPQVFQPLVSVDRTRVAAYLRSYLLVLPIGDNVWVFDARPVVKTTVAKREREADSRSQHGATNDPT